MIIIRDIVAHERDEYNYIVSKFAREHEFTRKSKRSKAVYVDDFITFDIETTTEDESCGYMYVWQACVGPYTVVGRTYSDLENLLTLIVNKCGLDSKKRMIIYVHNLGYESYYLSQLLSESFGAPDFLVPQSNKPLTMIFQNGLEFRDSYKLFQKSLDKATKGLPHHKLVGELDYNIKRTPARYLTSDEWAYCIWDVVGLREAILKLYADHGYTTATVPLTNTGIVRESVLAVVNHDPQFRAVRRETRPTREQLILLIESMAGGDTHGSRFFAGRTVDNCNMVDIKSAHPSQMLLQKYPMGRLKTICREMSVEDVLDLRDQYAMWCIVKMTGVVVKSECANPTISFSKCAEISDDYSLDNGRVIYAESLTVACDSNDIYRIAHSYDYDTFVVESAVMSKLGYLPASIRGVIKRWFTNKEAIEDRSDFAYMFSKICVNTIFGACAQKPARDDHIYISTINGIESKTISWKDKILTMSDDEYNQLFTERSLPFVWGTWTASMSRLQLYKMQEQIGWSRVLYWDTDSIYYKGRKATCIAVFNAYKHKQVIARDAVVTNYKGERVYIGSFEDDYPNEEFGIKQFRFLHAKCYGKVSSKGLQWTIAGVAKDCAKRALRNIDDLKDGYYISNAGGMKVKYVSAPIQTIERSGLKFQSASYIVMKPRDYKVNWIPSEIISQSF